MTVLTSGPFTLSLKCEEGAAGKTKETFTATSSEANSLLDSSTPGTTATVNAHESKTPSTSTGTARSFIAPSGAFLEGVSNDGVNVLGADCFVEFSGLSS